MDHMYLSKLILILLGPTNFILSAVVADMAYHIISGYTILRYSPTIKNGTVCIKCLLIYGI